MSEDIPSPSESFDETPYPQPVPKRMRRRMKYDYHSLNKLSVDLSKWVDENVESKRSFLLTDWCMERGVNKSIFAKKKGVSEAFDEAWNYAKDWQEHMLVKGALFKKLNVRFVMFMLQCCHGWRPENFVDPREKDLANELEQFRLYMQSKGEEPTKQEINAVLRQAKSEDKEDALANN